MKPAALLAMILAATAPRGTDAGISVVATTTFVGDVVSHVAGDKVQLSVLVPPGIDPHAFEPTPRDAAVLSKADIIFINGAGLEDSYMPKLLARGAAKARVVDLSEGVARRMSDDGEKDPHLWLDPSNVAAWTDRVARSLQESDPAHRADFEAGAADYKRKLEELERRVAGLLDRVPLDQRKLVTDHDSFGYFADRYGFRIVGAVIPSFNAGGEPSARDLARLVDTVRNEKVKTIFVAASTPPDLVQRVAKECGIRVVTLDTCSLREGADYFIFMTELVQKIVDGLQ